MRNIYKITIQIIIFQLLALYAFAADPVSPNASQEARTVLNYLNSTFGQKILAAQHGGQSEVDYVHSVTGLYPAIWGTDLIFKTSDNSNYTFVVNCWNQGAIPTVMWHWGAPTLGDGYEQSKGTIDVTRCFQTGTAENIAMWADLKSRADFLTRLRDAKVPVIWRPMHECSGGWFWWDKSGGPAFVQLWKTMFDYFTKDRGLNNLIWVLGFDGSPSSAYNPGAGYYDIIGSDNYDYLTTSHIGMFNACKSIAPSGMPIAFHECGTPPDPSLCQQDGAMWSWFMIWDRDILRAVSTSHLQYVYNHDLVITLDEMNLNQVPAPTPTTGPAGIKGDVNSNGTIDIVDALLIAQYYVGLNPANFNASAADVNCSGGIDIVDALLIAQRYVGLISSFPCS